MTTEYLIEYLDGAVKNAEAEKWNVVLPQAEAKAILKSLRLVPKLSALKEVAADLLAVADAAAVGALSIKWDGGMQVYRDEKATREKLRAALAALDAGEGGESEQVEEEASSRQGHDGEIREA